MRQRTKTTTRVSRVRRRKLRTLLEAGYAEVGAKAKHLEREFARLDAESLSHVEPPLVKTASLRGFLKGMKVGPIREKRDRC